MGAESNLTGLQFDVTVSWGTVGSSWVAQWLLQRSDDLGVTYFTIATLPAATTSYIDRSVPHIELWYRVIAQNSVGQAIGESSRLPAPTTAQNITATNVAIPSAPLQVAAQTALSWTIPLDDGAIVAIQIVQRSDDAGLTWADVSPSLLADTNTFTDTTDLFAVIQLTWPAWIWAFEYEVQRSSDGITWTTVGTTVLTMFDDPLLPDMLNQYLHYRIVGVNSVGSTIGQSVGVYVIGGNTLRVCENSFYRMVWINQAGVSYGQPTANTSNPPVAAISYSTSEKPLTNTIKWLGIPAGNPLLFTPFILQRDEDSGPGDPSAILTITSDTTFVDSNIVPGHKYTYAVSVSGIGYQSPWVSLYSAGPVAPAAPTVIQDPLLPYVDVFWVPTYQSITYAVERSIDHLASFQRLASGIVGGFWVDMTLATDIAPTAAAEVVYRIVAADSLYEATGAETIFSNYQTPPSAPTLTLADGQVGIAWTGPANLSIDYDIERRTPAAWTWSVIGTVNGGSAGGLGNYTFTDTDVTAFTRYYYRIVGRNFVTATKIAGFQAAIVYKAPGFSTGLHFVVNGEDVSAIVERGTQAQASAQVTQKGGVADFYLQYNPDPPTILTR